MQKTYPPLYRKLRSAIAHQHAQWVLAAVSFSESVFFPIPPDFLLAPMTVTRPNRAWHLALWTTFWSVLGGMVGYLIGAFLMDYVGWTLVNLYQLNTHFKTLNQWFNNYGAIIILIGALSPIPYKAIAIMSGIVGINFSLFVLLGLIGRGTRFFMVAAICQKWGQQAEQFLLKHIMQSNLRDILTLIFISALSVLSGTLFLEYVRGLTPCTLCLWQRWPYYLILVCSAAGIVSFSQKFYLWAIYACLALLVISTGLGGYHAGIEWGLWQGFLECSSPRLNPQTIIPQSSEDLKATLHAFQPISCADPQWRLFGLSLAGYNMIISFFLSAYIIWRIHHERKTN